MSSLVDLLYADPCFKAWLLRRGVLDAEDVLQETAILLLTDTPPEHVHPRAAIFVQLKHALSARSRRAKALKRFGTLAIEELGPARKALLS
jgi:hypothetical protein